MVQTPCKQPHCGLWGGSAGCPTSPALATLFGISLFGLRLQHLLSKEWAVPGAQWAEGHLNHS